MVQGIETAARGMMSILNLNDIVANNLANVNTPGFKQLLPTFRNMGEEEFLSKPDKNSDVENKEQQNVLGTLSVGSMLDSTGLDFKQGPIQKTGRNLDIAINGEGFFSVQTETGEYYTRAGSFTLDGEGDLTTHSGAKVLGENGRPINIDIETRNLEDITINDAGVIFYRHEELDRIKIVDFEDKSKLITAGNSLYKNIDKNNSPEMIETPHLMQGYLENSNANAIESMISTITGTRTYETLSKVVKDTDATLKRAINEVGVFRG
ncbi:MAG: flagellar basal-body rod protein FlgF [Candidatus Gastranaerophilales bacterium]|jgi:flagellar basal-body rod protein FlgF|nr:flagellar basal-body rod protein FlgF [Candidatus Gastranaerophilales bacterium]